MCPPVRPPMKPRPRVSGSDETSFDDLAGDSADSKLAQTLLLMIEPGDEFRNTNQILKQTVTEPHPYASSRLHLFGTRPP
jgi:hypothetical protein